MKILLISDNSIFGHGGGSLEERKYYDGIKEYVNNNGGEFKVLTIDKVFEDSLTSDINKKKSYDYGSRLLGHSSFMYFVWKKHKKDCFEFNPDIVFLGRSRLGFIAKDIKKHLPGTAIVCCLNNVEYDYVDAYFANNDSFLKKLYIKLEKKCVYNDELLSVKYLDVLSYLTNRDKKRMHELYDTQNREEMILPICVSDVVTLTKMSAKRTVVFIGSLGYESNSSALFEFIENVWLPYFAENKDIELIVGGSNPSIALENTLQSIPNASLYKNFDSLRDIVPKRSMIIAPIQKGAGMKVKVAESLSMGLLIAASDEALVGYEEALQFGEKEGIMRANLPDEYKKAIDSYLSSSEETLIEIEKQNTDLFKRYYQYNRSRKYIHDLIEMLSKKRIDEDD